jgi:hypothetical protein
LTQAVVPAGQGAELEVGHWLDVVLPDDGPAEVGGGEVGGGEVGGGEVGGGEVELESGSGSFFFELDVLLEAGTAFGAVAGFEL